MDTSRSTWTPGRIAGTVAAALLMLAGLTGSGAAATGPDQRTAQAAQPVAVASDAVAGTADDVDGSTWTELPFPRVLPTPGANAPSASPTPSPAAPSARSPGVVVAGDLLIPARVLAAYTRTGVAFAASEPACHLPWQLLAGIGRIESNHARDGALLANGTTVRPILGPELDGSPGRASIPDTDRGRYDHDPVWDRAVGPMQFIPTTWVVLGRDGNGDHVADPSNIDDAVASAAGYLCGYDRDLRVPAELRQAVRAYNHSDAYVAAVLAWMQAYTTGRVSADPGTPAVSTPPGTPPGTPPSQPGQPLGGTPAPTSAAPAPWPGSPSGGPSSDPSPQPRQPSPCWGRPSPDPGPTLSPVPSATVSGTDAPTPSADPTEVPTPSDVPTPTATAAPTPTGSPTPTPSPTPSAPDCARPTP
jgi:membrane-bound lytic murein transglycosylase B